MKLLIIMLLACQVACAEPRIKKAGAVDMKPKPSVLVPERLKAGDSLRPRRPQRYSDPAYPQARVIINYTENHYCQERTEHERRNTTSHSR